MHSLQWFSKAVGDLEKESNKKKERGTKDERAIGKDYVQNVPFFLFESAVVISEIAR